MEKLQALLKQLGGSDELAKSIVSTLAEHKTKLNEDASAKLEVIKAELKEHFKKQMEKAKEVCVEEVTTYKKNLARKVQIFLESKADKIESQVAKQALIEESAAASKLERISALVGGHNLASIDSTNAELTAAKREVKKLTEEKAKLASEKTKVETECKQAKTIAENAQSLASQTIERNKELSRELNESKKTQPIEAQVAKVQAASAKPAQSQARPVVKPITESKAPQNTLPARKATPVVTRQPQVSKLIGTSEISKIADSIND